MLPRATTSDKEREGRRQSRAISCQAIRDPGSIRNRDRNERDDPSKSARVDPFLSFSSWRRIYGSRVYGNPIASYSRPLPASPHVTATRTIASEMRLHSRRGAHRRAKFLIVTCSPRVASLVLTLRSPLRAPPPFSSLLNILRSLLFSSARLPRPGGGKCSLSAGVSRGEKFIDNLTHYRGA